MNRPFINLTLVLTSTLLASSAHAGDQCADGERAPRPRCVKWLGGNKLDEIILVNHCPQPITVKLDVRHRSDPPPIPLQVWEQKKMIVEGEIRKMYCCPKLSSCEDHPWTYKRPVDQAAPPQPPTIPPPLPVDGTGFPLWKAALQSFHSGKCLKVSDSPTAADCGGAVAVDILPVENSSAVILRRSGTDQCLYANKDGRFHEYNCTPAWSDQHWLHLVGDANTPADVKVAGDRMLKSVHNGKCLISNKDGRFQFVQCLTHYSDQYWHTIPGKASLQNFNSGKCLQVGSTPKAADCSAAAAVDILPVKSSSAVMIRRSGTDKCLFANKDGRFGEYTCTPAYSDQHWMPSPGDATTPAAVRAVGDRMLKSVNAGTCLISNKDGRFQLVPCLPQYNDQYWHAVLTP